MLFILGRSRLILGLLIFLVSGIAQAGIWDDVRREVEPYRFRANYQDVVRALYLQANEKLLTDPFPSDGRPVVLDNGAVAIDSDGIRSFASTQDFDQGKAEFEYPFQVSGAEPSASRTCPNQYDPFFGGQEFKGISFLLDIIPSHPYYNNETYGDLPYPSFVLSLQERLASVLRERGAEVSIFRPAYSLSESDLAQINSQPPFVVLSTQFNNDKAETMTTFSEGHYLPGELKTELQRARFVHALLTEKAVRSAKVAAWISRHVHENKKMNVELLRGKKYSFYTVVKGVPTTPNVQGISASVPGIRNVFSSMGIDPNSDEFYDGCNTRNLFMNRILSKAVAIPFLDMEFVRKEAARRMTRVSAKDAVSSLIQDYVESIRDGLINFIRDREN